MYPSAHANTTLARPRLNTCVQKDVRTQPPTHPHTYTPGLFSAADIRDLQLGLRRCLSTPHLAHTEPELSDGLLSIARQRTNVAATTAPSTRPASFPKNSEREEGAEYQERKEQTRHTPVQGSGSHDDVGGGGGELPLSSWGRVSGVGPAPSSMVALERLSSAHPARAVASINVPAVDSVDADESGHQRDVEAHNNHNPHNGNRQEKFAGTGGGNPAVAECHTADLAALRSPCGSVDSLAVVPSVPSIADAAADNRTSHDANITPRDNYNNSVWGASGCSVAADAQDARYAANNIAARSVAEVNLSAIAAASDAIQERHRSAATASARLSLRSDSSVGTEMRKASSDPFDGTTRRRRNSSDLDMHSTRSKKNPFDGPTTRLKRRGTMPGRVGSAADAVREKKLAGLHVLVWSDGIRTL